MALLVLVLSAMLYSAFALKGLPKSVCSLGAPQEELDSCLLDYIQSVTPTVAPDGVPELGLQPLDPLALPKITANLNSKFVKGVVVLTDTVLGGLRNTQIKQLKSSFADEKNLYLEVIAVNKHLRISGLFDKRLNVGTTAVVGRGDYKLSVRNVKTRVRIYSHVETRDGKDYVHVDRVEIKPRIGKLKVDGLKLDQGNKQLETLVVETVERFWHQIYDAVYPLAEPHIANIVKTKINELMLKVPYSDFISA